MNSTRAIEALAALAHEHRLGVYRMLIEAGPAGLNAGTIASRLKLPPSSLTFHLQHLQRAGLISQVRQSRQLIYAADFESMHGLISYLTQNCCRGASVCEPAVASAKAARKTSKAA